MRIRPRRHISLFPQSGRIMYLTASTTDLNVTEVPTYSEDRESTFDSGRVSNARSGPSLPPNTSIVSTQAPGGHASQ